MKYDLGSCVTLGSSRNLSHDLETYQDSSQMVSVLLFWQNGRNLLISNTSVCGRPPRYAPPLSSPVGTEVPRVAEQTAT